QTDGQLCWQAHSSACRRTITAAISLSASGNSGDHRPARRRRRTRPYSAQGLCRLDVLERSPHLLSDWHQESFRCRHYLAVELRDLQARGPPYYRGPSDRSCRIASGCPREQSVCPHPAIFRHSENRRTTAKNKYRDFVGDGLLSRSNRSATH